MKWRNNQIKDEPQGLKPPVFSGFCGTAEQAAERLSKYGHFEEEKTTKNLHLADSYNKQVLRFAQNDRQKKYYFHNL